MRMNGQDEDVKAAQQARAHAQGEGMDAPAGLWLREARYFFIALQFFTRIPVPARIGFDSSWLQHSTRYFPLIGLLVASIAALVYAACVQVLPQSVAVLLSTGAGIYLTGAFHEDGFADVCDGFGGGYTSERTLEIMKDSRIGAYGAIGIGMLLAVKCFTLASLPGTALVAAALMAGHTLSRALSATLIWRMDYARHEGKAKPLGQEMSGAEFTVAMGTALAVLALTGSAGWLPWQGVFAGLLLALLATAWLARLFARRLRGFTGDCLGAVQQLSEVAFYLGVLAAGR